MTTNHAVLCGKCKVEAEVVREDSGLERVRCPRCAKTASKKTALKAAEEYAADKMAEAMDATLRKATAGSKFLTYKPEARSTKRRAWILSGL